MPIHKEEGENNGFQTDKIYMLAWQKVWRIF